MWMSVCVNDPVKHMQKISKSSVRVYDIRYLFYKVQSIFFIPILDTTTKFVIMII